MNSVIIIISIIVTKPTFQMPPGLMVSHGEHFITIKTDMSVFNNIINRKEWFLGSASEQHDPEFTMKGMEVKDHHLSLC